MSKFKIKETVFIPVTNVYEVEANSKEEARDKYINELTGSLELLDSYPNYLYEEGQDSIEVEEV